MKRLMPLAVALLLAGCGDGDATMTPTISAPPVTQSTPAPTPSGLTGQIGDTYVSQHVEVTVEEFNPLVTTTASDETWQAALVKSCVKSDDITLSTYPWKAISADGGRYGQTGGHYDDAPKPLYPFAPESVLAGECLRGWILFDTPADLDIVEVRYAPEGDPPGRWLR